MTFKFPKKLPKAWVEAIERNGRVGSVVHGMKIVAKDKRGTIVHLGGDYFKILHNGKNKNVFGNPLVGGLDPTFGYTTIGANDVKGRICDYIRGAIYTCPDSGTASRITAYLTRMKEGTKAKCAIYKHSDLSLVGATEEKTGMTGDAWRTFNFSAPKPSLVANTVYILVAWSDLVGTIWHRMAYDDGASNQGHYLSRTYDGIYPDPLPTPSHDSYKYSIYCTYTTITAPTVTTQGATNIGFD